MVVSNPKMDSKVDAMVDLVRSFDTDQVRCIVESFSALSAAVRGLASALLTEEQKQAMEKIFRG